MAPTSINAFRPFNLQHDEGEGLHIRLQKVIYYGESRFRAAVARIIMANDRHHRWMQECLQHEVLFVMAYAGMATATGQHIDIPIVLRSLVTSLSLIHKESLPVPFDSALIALLEVGTSDEEFGRVVKKYAHNWWDKTQEPAAESLLHSDILDECLDYHDEQLLKSNEPRKRVEARDINVTLPYQMPNFVPEDGAEGAEFQPVTVQTRGFTARVETCKHCAQNGCILIGALCHKLFTEIKATQRFVSAMAVSSKAEVSVAVRRCAGFYRLHERVQEKELLSDSITVEGTGRGTEVQKTSRRVAEIAAGELEQYKAMPSSAKWTWGETLTTDDVLALRHTRGKDVRTGYGTDLPQGRLSGEYSAPNSSPTRSANFSSVPRSVERVPSPTSLLFPSNVGSYGLNSDIGAGSSAGGVLMEDVGEGDQTRDVDDVDSGTLASTMEEEEEEADDHAASIAADMWSPGAAGGTGDAVPMGEEEEDTDDDGGASVAADLWLEGSGVLLVAAGTRALVPGEDEEEEEEEGEEDDEDDAATVAADMWLDGDAAQSGTGGAGHSVTALQHDDEHQGQEEYEDEDGDAASLAADMWLGPGVGSVAGGAGDLHTTEEDEEEQEEEAEEDGEDDAASVAADMWLEGAGVSSVASGAGDLALITEEDEEEQEEEEEEDGEDHDPASIAADMWLDGAGVDLMAAGASGLSPTMEEEPEEQDEEEGEDDEDDDAALLASLAADLWLDGDVEQSGTGGAGNLGPVDEDQEEEEEDEDEDDDPASMAADLWLDGEAAGSAPITEGLSHNTCANTSVIPRTYTPADFPNEWLDDDSDAEHEVDLGVEDLHLVD